MKSSSKLWIAALVVAAAGGGWLAGELMRAHPDAAGPLGEADGPCPNGAQPLYWKAPMDPTFVRNEPGKSPMGMDLVAECPNEPGAPNGKTVQIDSTTMHNIGVRTAAVERRDLSRSIRAVGRVAYDERRVSHVHTKVQGWVEGLLVDYVGQEVKKGQPLLEIYSPELVATQEELLLAARYRESTGESPFEEVRGGGESLFDATKRRLELWDIPERDVERLLETSEVKRTLTLYAPSSGVVTRLGVRTGMEVKPNDNLYTIADLSSVWVVANVYEYELPWIALGQEGVVELSYLPGLELTGRVTYVSPFLAPKTRTAEVRFDLPNPDGMLKPEMFGNTFIAGSPKQNVIAIPQEAVIRSGRRTLAIVALGEGRFEPRDLALGLDSGDGWLEVLEGLVEGEEIVVSSQFLIDSESNLQEAIGKLLDRPEQSTSRPPIVDHSGHAPPPAPSPHHEHEE